MRIIMIKPMEGILFVYSMLFSILRMSTALDTITPTLSIRDGETLASAAGRFELGFFSPGNSKSRYLGIWYKFSTSTIVWVANGEVPLIDRSGVLTLTHQGILVLVNGTNSIIWSSATNNTSRTVKKNPVGQLLDSGNLVVKDGHNENFLWQSFDHPCDTLLPGMKLGWNLVTGLHTFLSSWKSTEDPAPGNFTVEIDLHGFPQLVVKNGPTIQFRIGSWDGKAFTGLSSLKPDQQFKSNYVVNEKEVYHEYESLNSSRIARIVLRPSGVRQVYEWLYGRNDWALFFTESGDQCETYASCGAYASCNTNHDTLCSCLEGFVPKSPKEWALLDSDGCIRKTPLACNNSDGFLKYTRVKLPDTSTSWFNWTMSLNECKQQCLKNCSCVAYANLDVRGEGSGCLLWFDKLIDMREFADSGEDQVYIRVAASELGRATEKRRHSTKKLKAGIIVSSVSFVTGVLILGFVLYIRKKKLINKGIRQKGHTTDYINEDGKEDLELPIFDLTTIANAIDNFSSNNKLGQGGFGPVYKGTMIEGQEIAVKRLSINSRQGLKEFKNEVILIAKLQHRKSFTIRFPESKSFATRFRADLDEFEDQMMLLV